jgi:predicted exporter
MPASSDRRRTGLFSVSLFLGTCALVLGLTDWDRRLSTKILDLLPADDTSVEARFLTGYFREKQADQVVFALHRAEPENRDAGVAGLLHRLNETGVFREGIVSARATFDQVAASLFENRHTLLFPAWLQARRDDWQEQASGLDFPNWLAVQTVDSLDAFLGSPEGFFYADGMQADPLLLLPTFWQSLPEGRTGVQTDWTLLAATLRESAFDDAVQDAVVATLARVRTAIAQEFPDATLLVTGPVLFARSSRLAIRGEVERLNLFTLLAVAAVILLALRRPIGMLAIAPLMVCGLAGGLMATVVTFGSVHIVMLVLGAFLAGITVDYGFHAFLHPAGSSDSSLWKPLSAAAGSTAAGFLALMFGTLPVVRQLGLFVSAGVLSALFAAYCLRPLLPANLIATRGLFQRAFVWKWNSFAALVMIPFLLAGAIAGISRIHWRDDIRELDLPSPHLLTEDGRIRDLSGSTLDRPVLVTTAASFLGAIDAWRDLNRDWKSLETQPLASLGALLPSSHDLATARSFIDDEAVDWSVRLQNLLEKRDYDPVAFADFFEAFAQLAAKDLSDEKTEARLRSLSEKLNGPIGVLLPQGGEVFAVASIAGPIDAAVRSVVSRHPETVPASQLESLNEVFARYRQESWKLVLAGFLVIAVAVLFICGISKGAGVLAIPVFGVTVTFGLLGWLQRDLNLFHLLAGLLGFCLALDHALFAVQARTANRPPPPSVRISALTTVAAFGVLATSKIQAVSALGWTVASAITATALFIEVLAAALNDPKASIES